MEEKKYVGLSALRTLVDNIKSLFVTKTDLNSALNQKAPLSHDHNSIYYTKEQINDMEFIATSDIDDICNTNVVIATSDTTF